METLGILDEIHVLVHDKRQVVSYKWLSRNFSVSSNDAKRLLQEFVEKNGNGPKTVYTLFGRLKHNPQVYHIRLVSGRQLSEVKQQFEDDCSVQVYSVQDSIPKDPAALWSDEFVQAEELFNQPANADNCLRDNRYCGISNSFVKRSINGEPGGALHKIGVGISVSSKVSGLRQAPPAPQPQQGRLEQPSTKPAVLSTENKSRSNALKTYAEASKDKATTIAADKKKGQNDRNSSGAGGSLANMWGRASVKSKQSPAETTYNVQNPVTTADAQIAVHEALDSVSSDDDAQDVSCKRESNGESCRKRRFVFDYSDDEDDHEKVVSLASPDPLKREPILNSKWSVENIIPEKKELDFEEKKGDKLEIKQEKRTGLEDEKKDKATSASSTSPKRQKVLRTRIDERGREVTEVVWEGEAGDGSNANNNATTNAAENRPPATSKTPAPANTAPSNPVVKAGNKKTAKGGGKDVKQGKILSFFKKA